MIVKNPDQTRKMLLQAAYLEIQRNGFQAACLASILAHTNLTKGALYHHFPNKLTLGYAVVDDIIREDIIGFWVTPLEDCENPIDCLLNIIYRAGEEYRQEYERCGCPLNNLAQEMSPVDEIFRQKINHIYVLWRQGISQALAKGQANGSVRSDIQPDAAATFIIAAIEGCVGMAKNAQDINVLYECGAGLVHYLESLRLVLVKEN